MTPANEDVIELRVDDLAQLFHTLDPFPFRERDLDREVEEYIVGWARELAANQPIRIVIDFPDTEAQTKTARELSEAFSRYFSDRAGAVQRDLNELFRVGRRSLAIGVAMVTGFEEGMLLAFLGGLTLDMLLPERPVGSTTLTLLAVVGLSLLVARATEPTRLILIAGTAFALTFLFQAVLLALLALTAGVGITVIPVTSFALGAVMNAFLAVLAAWLTRAFMLRFGPAERAHW